MVLGQQHAHADQGVGRRLRPGGLVVRRQRVFATRKLGDQGEGRAAAGLGLGFQPTAHGLGQGARDRQAQAAAAELAGDRAVGLLEAREQPLLGLGVEARTGVVDIEAQFRTVGAVMGLDRQPHPSGLRELHRIAQQVGQDLPDAGGVADIGAQGVRGDRHLQVQALGLGGGVEQGAAGVDRTGQVEGLGPQLHLAGLDAGQVEDVAEQGFQRLGRGFDQRDHLALRGRQRRAGQGAGHAHDAVERGADLVAHIGQEFGLGAVGRFGLGRRPLQRLGRLVQRRDVLGDPQQMALVAFVAEDDVLDARATPRGLVVADVQLGFGHAAGGLGPGDVGLEIG